MDVDKLKLQALAWWSWWEAQSASRKLTMACAGAVFLSLLAVVGWTAQPEYRALYTGLSPEDMGQITNKLKSKGIIYKLDANGTLFVRAEQAAQVHVDLNSEGVLGNAKLGKGLERFENTGVGATPFDQRMNYLHAQQADLARAIMQIDPIIYARVFIARPQTSLFMRERKPATASIMIKIRPGGVLERNALHSIASFVAGSVEGLQTDDVTIMDGTKKILYQSRDSELGLGGAAAEQHKEIEVHLANQAERMLTAALGPGRVAITVRAELNNKLLKEKIEAPMVDGKVIATESSTESKLTSPGAVGKGGAPGTGGVFNKNAGTNSSENGTKSTSLKTDTKYDYPRKVQEWQQKYGEIERLSIAAVVDLSPNKSGKPAMTIEEVEEIIKKATGFKKDRDEIQVTQVEMPLINSDALDEEWASHQRLQTILTVVRNGSIAAVTLCVGGLGIVYLRRRLGAAAAAAIPAPTTEPQPDKLQRIAEEFSRNPEVLAQVLSRWMEQSDPPNRMAA